MATDRQYPDRLHASRVTSYKRTLSICTTMRPKAARICTRSLTCTHGGVTASTIRCSANSWLQALSGADRPTLGSILSWCKPTTARSTDNTSRSYCKPVVQASGTAVSGAPTTTHLSSVSTVPSRKSVLDLQVLSDLISRARYLRILPTTTTNGYTWDCSAGHRLKCCRGVEVITCPKPISFGNRDFHFVLQKWKF